MGFSSNKNIKGIFYAAFAFLLYCIADSLVKELSATYGGAYSGFLILCASCVFILLFFKQLGGTKAINVLKTPKRKWLILRGISGSLGFFLLIVSIKHIDLATAYVLALTAPLWATFFAFLLHKEKIEWHRLLTTVAGFAAIIMILRPEGESISFPMIGMLGVGFFSACSIIISKKIGEKEPIAHVVLYIEGVSFIGIGIFCIFYADWAVPKIMDIFYMALSSLFYLMGMICAHRAFSMAETSAVAPIIYMQIIWGSLIGYFIFHEIPDKYTVLGGTIIVASGLYLIYREHTKRA